MPTDLNALRVFEKVVRTGSFTAAARALDMPKSTVSLRVAELETRLGACLLQRSTRRLGLTDQGRLYHDHCARILADIDEADRAVTDLQGSPRGLLRITLPASMQFVGPVITSFLAEHPGVQVEILCADRIVSLIDESFDVAIRAGALPDSALVARSLGVIPFVLAASPRYLRRRGRPRAPADLLGHACLLFGATPTRTWQLARGAERVELEPPLTLRANDLDILHGAAVGGSGVAILPAFRCADDFRAKRLERVLPEWSPPAQPVHAVYPTGRHLSPKVKLLLDHLQRTKSAPWVR